MNQHVNQQFGKLALEQAEKFFTYSPRSVQAMAEKGVAASQEFYTKTAAVVQDSAKALAEIAETAWGSTKMLNERLALNVAANVETAFAAARQIAAAKSLSDVTKLQAELVQKLSSQTAEQTKELLDLSTRATQHVLEKVQSAATRPLGRIP